MTGENTIKIIVPNFKPKVNLCKWDGVDLCQKLKNLNNFLFEVDGKFSMNVFPTAIDIEADAKDFAQRCKWGQWIARRTKLLNVSKA